MAVQSGHVRTMTRLRAHAIVYSRSRWHTTIPLCPSLAIRESWSLCTDFHHDDWGWRVVYTWSRQPGIKLATPTAVLSKAHNADGPIKFGISPPHHTGLIPKWNPRNGATAPEPVEPWELFTLAAWASHASELFFPSHTGVRSLPRGLHATERPGSTLHHHPYISARRSGVVDRVHVLHSDSLACLQQVDTPDA